jgi:hypothetical protein
MKMSCRGDIRKQANVMSWVFSLVNLAAWGFRDTNQSLKRWTDCNISYQYSGNGMSQFVSWHANISKCKWCVNASGFSLKLCEGMMMQPSMTVFKVQKVLV